MKPKCERAWAICLRPRVNELGSNTLVLGKAIAPGPYNLRVVSSMLMRQSSSMIKFERFINLGGRKSQKDGEVQLTQCHTLVPFLEICDNGTVEIQVLS